MIYWWCPACNAEGSIPFTVNTGSIEEGLEIERSVNRDHYRKVTVCPRYRAKKNEAVSAIIWDMNPIKGESK